MTHPVRLEEQRPLEGVGRQRLEVVGSPEGFERTVSGIGRAERVAVYLEKRIENVAACFGATAAGAESDTILQGVVLLVAAGFLASPNSRLSLPAASM